VSDFYLIVVRKSYRDENDVITAYESYLSRCLHCIIFRGSKREDFVLYNRDYRYTRDIANYIFAQNGKYFSVVANEKENCVQVKISPKTQEICSLLAAIKDGLVLHSQKSNTGIQYNYIHQK